MSEYEREMSELRAEAEQERRDSECADCMVRAFYFLTIPDYDPDDPDEAYPGGIQPGRYTRNQVVNLLRQSAENPEAVRFLADMLEE